MSIRMIKVTPYYARNYPIIWNWPIYMAIYSGGACFQLYEGCNYQELFGSRELCRLCLTGKSLFPRQRRSPAQYLPITANLILERERQRILDL